MKHITLKPDERAVYVTEQDILSNTGNFRNHRHYITHLFDKIGYEVIEWHSRYREDGTQIVQGLKYLRTDSDINITLEVIGKIGESIREKPGAAIVVS